MRDISLYLSTIPDYNQMLAGKNVLITTAARGIGKSIALLGKWYLLNLAVGCGNGLQVYVAGLIGHIAVVRATGHRY